MKKYIIILMECFDTTVYDDIEYKLKSDIILKSKKKQLEKESREQCYFTGLFLLGAGTSIATAVLSHGVTVPLQIPTIIVSLTSTGLCIKEYCNNKQHIDAIEKELDYRKQKNIKYIDSNNQLLIYDTTNDEVYSNITIPIS